jgi:hypothetical protein
LNVIDSQGKTVLDRVELYSDRDMIQILLDYGVTWELGQYGDGIVSRSTSQVEFSLSLVVEVSCAVMVIFRAGCSGRIGICEGEG